MRVLITGASSGIGEATALEFAHSGCRLFLTARRRERLERVAERCLSAGAPEALVSVQDLSVAGSGERVVSACLDHWPDLDVLICNAGYGIYGPLQEVSPAAMEKIWRVNVQSAYESIHRALPGFLSRRSGHIVLVSSLLGKVSLPMGSSYCATKFAMVGLGESLWGELRGSGVSVSVICPGTTRTEFLESAEISESAGVFRRLAGDSAETVSRAIVKAVTKRTRVRVLTRSGRAIWRFSRFFPETSAQLAAWFIGRSAKPK